MRVTLKLQPGLPSLRTPALKGCVEQAIDAGHERFGMRLLEHTLEKDGLSLLVTAPHRRALSRGIQGISVRIARAVNRKLERKGRLFADRYEAQLLSEVGSDAGAQVAAKPLVSKLAIGKPTESRAQSVSSSTVAARRRAPARKAAPKKTRSTTSRSSTSRSSTSRSSTSRNSTSRSSTSRSASNRSATGRGSTRARAPAAARATRPARAAARA